MRRQGILLLLILGCVSRLATGGVWWVRVPRGVYRIACTKDCKIRSRPEDFLGTAWWLSSRGHPTVCLGLPCKVWINRLSASRRYLRLLTPLAMRSLMMEVDDYHDWLFELYKLVCTRLANLEKNKPTRTCAKILKVRTYTLLLFSKRNLVAIKPFMSRVGEVVITDG
jgi:hypothetical protein